MPPGERDSKKGKGRKGIRRGRIRRRKKESGGTLLQCKGVEGGKARVAEKKEKGVPF